MINNLNLKTILNLNFKIKIEQLLRIAQFCILFIDV